MVFKPVDANITEIQKPLLGYFLFKTGTGELKNGLNNMDLKYILAGLHKDKKGALAF